MQGYWLPELRQKECRLEHAFTRLLQTLIRSSRDEEAMRVLLEAIEAFSRRPFFNQIDMTRRGISLEVRKIHSTQYARISLPIDELIKIGVMHEKEEYYLRPRLQEHESIHHRKRYTVDVGRLRTLLGAS